MSRMPSPHQQGSRLLVLVATLVLSGLCLFALRPARAGFGDLVKAGKDRAAQAAGKRVPGATTPAVQQEEQIEFTDDLVELTAVRVEGVIKGVQAGEAAAGDRTPLLARRKKLQDQIDPLVQKYGDVIDAARNKHNAVLECIDSELQDAAHKREKEMEKTAQNDPAMRAKLLDLSMRMAQAQMSGDSLALRKVMEEMYNFGGPTREDTLAAQKECGPVPKLHPMGVKVDSLQALVESVNEDLRKMDKRSDRAQVQASGLTSGQLAMSKERIILYLQAVKSGQAPRGFTSGERKVLDEHRDALSSALGKYLD